METYFKSGEVEELINYLEVNKSLRIHEILINSLNNKLEDEKEYSRDNFLDEWKEGNVILALLTEGNLDYGYKWYFVMGYLELVIKMSEHILDNKINFTNELIVLQNELIELLKSDTNQFMQTANMMLVKVNLISIIGSKQSLGKSLLDLGKAYESIAGLKPNAIKVYRDILNGFESESVKNSSGLFPEISQVDTRTKAEIEIFESAKLHLERLSGEKLQEINRIHVNNDQQAKVLVKEVLGMEKEILDEKSNTDGIFSKLKKLWKKN